MYIRAYSKEKELGNSCDFLELSSCALFVHSLSSENGARTTIAPCEASDFIILMSGYKSKDSDFFNFISSLRCKQLTRARRRMHN